jgi:hypothetical protein
MRFFTRADLVASLQAAGVVDAPRAEELRAHLPPPPWLMLLQGVAAWVAALFLLASFAAPLLMLIFGEGPLGRGVYGLILLGAAIWLFSKRKNFTDQMALAFSIAGQAMCVSAFMDVFDAVDFTPRGMATVALLLAVLMSVPRSTQPHRIFCALVGWGSLGVLIGSGNPFLLFAVALTALAVTAWLQRERWATHPRAPVLAAVAHGATLGALVAAWGVSNEFARMFTAPVSPWIYKAGVGMVLVGAAGWLTRETDRPVRLVVLAGAVLFSAAAWNAPGLVASVAVLAAAFRAAQQSWVGLALLAIAWYLSWFYYSLETTLLVKSGALAATGLVLLAVAFALRRWGRAA